MQFYNTSTITVKATGSLSVENSAGVAYVTTPAFNDSQTLTLKPTSAGSLITFPTQTYQGATSVPGGALTGTSTLQSFNGTGTVTLPVVASASSSFTSSSGNGYGSSVTDALANIYVVYRYALVPEPSSFVLAGVGLAGLLAVCRHRMKGLKAA